MERQGCRFLTPPKQHAYEIRCYIRDPDGHLIEVGQTTDPGDWTPPQWLSSTAGGRPSERRVQQRDPSHRRWTVSRTPRSLPARAVLFYATDADRAGEEIERLIETAGFEPVKAARLSSRVDSRPTALLLSNTSSNDVRDASATTEAGLVRSSAAHLRFANSGFVAKRSCKIDAPQARKCQVDASWSAVRQA
jgi:hypothetical protein